MAKPNCSSMVSSETTDITYRLAAAEDERAITEISYDIYDGMDHAMSFFSKWLTDERWFLFVAECGKKNVIAFTALHLVDGGEKVFNRSSRVAKSYRARGIIKALMSYACLHVKKFATSVQKVISLRETTAKLPKVNYTCLKQISKLDILCESDREDFQSQFQKFESGVHCELLSMYQHKEYSLSEFYRVFDNLDSVRSIFTNSVFHTGGDVYDINIEKNERHLQNLSLQFIVSRNKSHDMVEETVVAPALMSVKNDTPMVSIMGCPKVVLDIYLTESRNSLDLNLLKFHVFQFLEHESVRFKHEHQFCASFWFESNNSVKEELKHFSEACVGMKIIDDIDLTIMELDINNC